MGDEGGRMYEGFLAGDYSLGSGLKRVRLDPAGNLRTCILPGRWAEEFQYGTSGISEMHLHKAKKKACLVGTTAFRVRYGNLVSVSDTDTCSAK